MIYIFEGCDLSGKSYIAKQVSELTNIPVVKKPFSILNIDKEKLKSDDIERYTHFFWESLYPVGIHYPLIYDRSLVSSIVFSKMFNRKYPLDYAYKALLNNKDKVKVFLITANHETLKQRFETRGEKFFELDELIKIQDLFIDVCQVLEKENANIEWVDNSKENEQNAITKCFSRI